MLPLSVVNKNFPRRAVPVMPTVDQQTTANFNQSFFLSTEAFPSCKPIVKNLHAVTLGKMMKDPASTSEHLGALLILLLVLVSVVTRNGDEKAVRKTKGEQRETEATEPMEQKQSMASSRVSKDDDSVPSLHPHEHHSSDSSVSTSGDVDVHTASDDEEESVVTKTREETVPPVLEDTQEVESPVSKKVSFKEDDVTNVTIVSPPPTSPPTSTARTSSAPSYQTAMLSAAALTLLAVTLSRSRK